MKNIFVTSDSFQTKKIGEDLASKLKGGDIVALYGDLGSGKTTFVQGLARGLGIKQRIISPTFIIVRKYGLSREKGNSLDFYHIDLYRIDEDKDLPGLGISEILRDENSVVAIEWAEKITSILPKKRWEVKFEHLEGDKRRITLYFLGKTSKIKED